MHNRKLLFIITKNNPKNVVKTILFRAVNYLKSFFFKIHNAQYVNKNLRKRMLISCTHHTSSPVHLAWIMHFHVYTTQFAALKI